MQVVSGLIGSNLLSQSKKSLKELRVIEKYLMDKLLSASPFNLVCIIIHFMLDKVSTKKSKHVFSFPLLLMDIFVTLMLILHVSNKNLQMPLILYLVCPSVTVALS